MLVCRKMKIDPYLSPCKKLMSKRIKDLNIKPDTLNLIEEKVGKSLDLIETGRNFLNRTPMAHALISRIDKWDLMELESFCKEKDIINKTNRQPTDWEKYSLTPHPIEG
jgi:predicted RNA-binding protein